MSYANVSGSKMKRLETYSSNSSDFISIQGAMIDQLFARLGAGDDQLRVTNTRVELGGIFDGQGGHDSLFERANVILSLGRNNFEFVDIG
jgi:hypothetical protein